MTSYPIGLLLIASLACGQIGGAPQAQPGQSVPPSAPSQGGAQRGVPTPQPPGKTPSEPTVVHRLETVIWNPAAGELSWVITVWNVNGATEQQIAKKDYSVKLDNATMRSNGEVRTFDQEEAKQVRMVMDLISAYAVVSTVWWERGQGGKPGAPETDGGKDKDKNKEQEKPAPQSRPVTVSLPGPVAEVQSLPIVAPARGR